MDRIQSRDPLNKQKIKAPANKMWKYLSLPQSRVFLISLGVLLLMIVLSKWSLHVDPDTSYLKKHVSRLLAQSRHCYQDSKSTDPLRNLIQANYALAYLSASRMLLPDKSLTKISKTPVHSFLVSLEHQQQQAVSDLGTVCPNLRVSPSYQTQINGL